MENRLGLNTKPTFEVPIDIEYVYRNDKPNAKSTGLRIARRGNVGKILKDGETRSQEFHIEEVEGIRDFIEKTDWHKVCPSMSASCLEMWRLKKIILEEFYGD